MMHAIERFNAKGFYRYMHNQHGLAGALQRDTEELMSCVDAPLNMQEYDAEEHVPTVVDYWNNVKFAGKRRIKVWIFNAMGHYKPTFRYGPDNWDTAVILYHSDNSHFDGVRRDGYLFGQRYCLYCEAVFSKEKEHTKKCKGRCMKWWVYGLSIYIFTVPTSFLSKKAYPTRIKVYFKRAYRPKVSLQAFTRIPQGVYWMPQDIHLRRLLSRAPCQQILRAQQAMQGLRHHMGYLRQSRGWRI